TNLERHARALMSMQRLSFCFAHWIGWRSRAALPRQVLRMASSHQKKKKKFRQPLAAKLLPERSEQLEIERSLFEPAEYPTMQPEANSKPSPQFPAAGRHSGSRPAQPGLLLEMPQSRARSASKDVGPFALGKTRARPSGLRPSVSRE